MRAEAELPPSPHRSGVRCAKRAHVCDVAEATREEPMLDRLGRAGAVHCADAGVECRLPRHELGVLIARLELRRACWSLDGLVGYFTIGVRLAARKQRRIAAENPMQAMLGATDAAISQREQLVSQQ